MKEQEKNIKVFRYVPLVIALALGIFWAVTIYDTGVSISPDSGYYLTYGLNMHHAGNYYVHAVRPPVYPLLVDFFMYFDGFPAGAAALVSGVFMILLLGVFALILQKFSDDVVLNTLFVIAFFAYDRLLFVFKYSWSEIPFALFTILNFYFLVLHEEKKKKIHYLGAAICVSLAVLTRYMGYALVGIFFFYTLHFLYEEWKKNHHAKGVMSYLLMNSVTYIPLILFLIRNYITSKTFHGSRALTDLTMISNAIETIHVLNNEWSYYFVLLLVIGSAVYCLVMNGTVEVKGKGMISLRMMTYLLIQMVMYIGIMIYTTSTVRVDPIATRYFSPVYSCFYLFIFLGFYILKNDGILNEYFGRWYRFGVGGVLYVLMAFIIFSNGVDFYFFLKQIHNGNVTPITAGYESGKNQLKLNRFIKDQLKKKDLLYIAGCHETSNKVNYPHLSATTLFRRGVITGKDVSGISFSEVSDKGYTLGFMLRGVKKQLIYRHLPLDRTEDKMLEGLKQIMEAEKIHSLLLITYTECELKESHTWRLAENLPEGLHSINPFIIDSYVIYEIETSN